VPFIQKPHRVNVYTLKGCSLLFICKVFYCYKLMIFEEHNIINFIKVDLEGLWSKSAKISKKG